MLNILMFFISIFMFSYFYKNLFMTLISLEFMMLSLLSIIFFVFKEFNNLNMLLFYLVFVVCESVLGLTMLILLIREKGNDLMKLINLII
uniref:NADH-ubiquinone oxidoreductase chain 4L n=1 Tax=Eupelmus sp. ZJUH_2016012 TaxID=2491156 RepID=A0A3S8V0L3_9HYME|nr:NADH dehydrogenase subunit 4L [Eupelmus sp. ZJUH_2016012]